MIQQNVRMDGLDHRWPDYDPLAIALLKNKRQAAINLIEANWDLSLVFNLLKFTNTEHQVALVNNKDLVQLVREHASQPLGEWAIESFTFLFQ